MPVPSPNLYPPFNIVRLSHIELVVTDLARSRAFYVDTLGLQVTYENDEEICLRGVFDHIASTGMCLWRCGERTTGSASKLAMQNPVRRPRPGRKRCRRSDRPHRPK